MRISSVSLLSSALLPSLAAALNFDCAHINKDGYKYDLSRLGGAHSLYHVETTEELTVNTTYVMNICNILGGKAIRGDLKCPTSKNICGFQYNYPTNDTEETSHAFPIVGLDHMGHGAKDPDITRLKSLDSDREGLLIKLGGGEYTNEQGKKKNAGAVIEFQCDPDRSGLEGIEAADIKRLVRVLEDEDGSGEGEGDGETPVDDGSDPERSLQFKSWGPSNDDSYVLSLTWRTRYACDSYVQDRDAESSGHWGFFTWVIIIFFLCAAAYLIFGSWLNYNRYGARGWDLLPHGDTVRDVPYIFQDWFRRVVNTLQGSGSRGGYSAV